MGNTDGALLYPDGSNHRCVFKCFLLFLHSSLFLPWKPCYGLKAYGVCMPAGFHIHGIDVSHYQGNIDWQRLTQTRQSQFPIHFIFMKASEGGDYGDRVFQANFDSAKAYGFIRGAYHFYNPKTDPVRQADFFINSVKLDTGDLPPVLDIESVEMMPGLFVGI